MKETAYNILEKALADVLPTDAGAVRDIEQFFRYKHIARNSFLLREGEEQLEIAFTAKGLFRYFYIEHSGNEAIKHFSKDGEWTFSLSAFAKRDISSFYIQAVEDSHILVCSADQMRELISSSGYWQRLYHMLLEKYYVIKEDREAAFLKNDAKGRYLEFLQEYPGLDKRLKQHQIASYLGITPVSLSRIRKSISY